MSVLGSNPLLLGTDSSAQISRSVRLRSSATAYFSRTFGTPTNNTVWTFSAWVKRGILSTNQTLMGGSTFAMFGFHVTDDQFLVWNNAGSSSGTATGSYRDPAAWYHCVVVSNGTTITAYINNKQVFTWAVTITNLNAAGATNYIGKDSSGDYFDGYLTEINFIDGQALTPSSFGQNDATTGVWGPKQYTGTYGTNGFYLKFADNSAATAAAIGKDSSGNGNNWTPNNISLTAGATYDSMTDVPVLTDATSSNYAVLNPTDINPNGSSQPIVTSNGNLSCTQTNTTGGANRVLSTIGVFSGKWYAELSISSITGGSDSSGVCVGWTGIAPASAGSGTGILEYIASSGNSRKDSGAATAYGATYTTNDIIGVALDMDAGQVTFYKNNASQGALSLTTGNPYSIGFTWNTAGTHNVAVVANFGQRPFTYTPPNGFNALNTYNLPDSTIKAGNKYFDATTYTGNGSTLSVTNNGGFQPDLVWYKRRDVSAQSGLFDSVRGATNYLASDQTAAESVVSGVTAFNSNGFSLGSAGGGNSNGNTFVGWQWKAGNGTTSSNTSGSITSTVSVNATAGFSVVKFAAPSSGTSSVGHGLGVAPSMVISKSLGSSNWITQHTSIGSQYVLLNSNVAAATDSTVWNSAATSTVVNMGTGFAGFSGSNMVMYCWSEVKGFSKFGSYTGTGTTDGPFVFCGFRPRLLLIKRSAGGTGNWVMMDTARSTYNAADNDLFANLTIAEIVTAGGAEPIDFLSNGFKLRYGGAGDTNTSGGTYIFAAFAENPFKNALAR